MRWPGRVELPAELRTALQLQPGERVLAVAHDPDGRAIVATDRDLLLQRRPPDYDRIGWDTIDKATYSDELLRITRVDETGESGGALKIPLPDPGTFPVVVRDRVSASIVVSQPVRLDDGRGVRVVARRRPGREALTWGYVVDPGIDAQEPELINAAKAAVARVRLDAGID